MKSAELEERRFVCYYRYCVSLEMTREVVLGAANEKAHRWLVEQ